MVELHEAKEQVLGYCQQLVREGYLKGTGGNVSMRIADKDMLAITPSNQDYLNLTPEDICVYDFSQKKIEGDLKPSIEMGFHIAVYRERGDVGSVIHTHQEMASAVALLNETIPALFDEQVRFLGRFVNVIPYAPSGTKFLVNQIRKTVGDSHNAYLMKNHGALVMGATIKKAYHNALLLEKTATAYLLSLCGGKPVDNIPKVVREIAFAKLRKEQKKVERELIKFASGAK